MSNIILPKSSFPSDDSLQSSKESKEFGLKVGQSIQFEWFDRVGGSCRFTQRWDEFHRRRLYARGEQSIGKYKDELAIDGDLSYMNLDWTPVPIIPKFVDIVVNGMSDRMFDIKAVSQDAMSQSKRRSFQNMIHGQMVSKDALNVIKENTGVNPFVMPQDELPNTEEELDLFMQLEYKPKIEIASEVAITTLLEENSYLDIKKRVDYDIAVLGMGIAKHSFSTNTGVRLEYVDPASVVHSATESPYFKDCYYWGEVKNVHYSELYKICPEMTDAELEEIQTTSPAFNRMYNSKQYDSDSSLFGSETCTLLYFNYKTTKKIVHKVRTNNSGYERVSERDDSFNPSEQQMEELNFRKLSKTIDVWYEGVMVMGTNIILKWEMCKNMVRPDAMSHHAINNYVACAPRMYKGEIESLVRRMIPFADLIQVTHLKLQQVIARVVPDGVFIDADGLNSVDLGNGAAYNPEEALKLYFQTGSVVGRSYTEDGEFNNGRVPIQQLTSSSGSNKAAMLISNYNHYLNMIRDATGLNEARDASTPDSNSLVGLQKLAALNSNTATRHILDGSLNVILGLAKAISLRISDILEYAPFKESFAERIGKHKVNILNEIKELYLYDFGISLQIAPDEEEKAKLEENIQMALSKGSIELEDAIDIRSINNIKLANQLLKVKRKRRDEIRKEEAEALKAIDAQANLKSQEMAALTAMQKQKSEIDGKIMLAKTQSQLDIVKMQSEAELKRMLMAEEFNYNMQLAGLQERNVINRDKDKEDRKDKRLDKQSSQQSKLIEQRQRNLPPTSFESNEDSLDGFEFNEFDPR